MRPGSWNANTISRLCPPAKLEGALAWANAERPRRLLIIASNFLSNAAKDYLSDYERNNKPPFEIRCWERPDLERLTAGHTRLLREYNISEQFPFVQIMHPAHLRFLREATLVDLHQLFQLLDELSEDDREGVLLWPYLAILSPRLSRAPSIRSVGERGPDGPNSV